MKYQGIYKKSSKAQRKRWQKIHKIRDLLQEKFALTPKSARLVGALKGWDKADITAAANGDPDTLRTLLTLLNREVPQPLETDELVIVKSNKKTRFKDKELRDAMGCMFWAIKKIESLELAREAFERAYAAYKID